MRKSFLVVVLAGFMSLILAIPAIAHCDGSGGGLQEEPAPDPYTPPPPPPPALWFTVGATALIESIVSWDEVPVGELDERFPADQGWVKGDQTIGTTRLVAYCRVSQPDITVCHVFFYEFVDGRWVLTKKWTEYIEIDQNPWVAPLDVLRSDGWEFPSTETNS